MSKLWSWIGGTIVYMWSAAIIAVVGWVIVNSLKSNQELFALPWSLPSHPQFQNYNDAWIGSNLGQEFLNSIVIVFLSVILILVISAPAAYVLTRIGFRGNEFFNQFFIVGIGIPAQVVLIPLYYGLSKLHLVNSLAGLILIYVSLSIPFTVFLLTGFLGSHPEELEEAAALDGANPIKIFMYIVIPLSRGGLITAGILNAVALWNEYMLALTFINDNSKYTLSLGVLSMSDSMQYSANWVGLFAGIVILIIPITLLYLWLNNRIIEGMTLGAGK